MPRVADLPPGWRHFTAGQKIEHLISLDRCCHEILSWEPITELDSVRLSFQMQVMRILLRIGLKAVLDAGSLRLLPTRPKQPGASKGATTSSPRPRTRSSNPVPSSSESIANPISLSLAAPYLACYTHRVAISNSRLVSLDKRGVTFRYKDYRRDGRARFRTMTLIPNEFIGRFLLHVLPKAFHRIRHYGLLASATCKANIARAKELIAAPSPSIDPSAEHVVADEAGSAADRRPPCPHCGGRMIIVESFGRSGQPRAPPP